MIEITNLNFAYKKQKVLQNINLSFKRGNIYGLLGENGVGKTTLLKIMSGLQNPQEGSCIVDGFISFDRKPEFLQNIFFLPEEILAPDTTPEKYIKSIGVFYPKFQLSLFHELMTEMEVDYLKKFAQLSYGQQKKSLIAAALSLRTDFLLLDEPTNGLDIPSKTNFRKVISRCCTDETTIIISTHQVKDVENLIDPIVILSYDEVLLNASFHQITQKLYFDSSTEKNQNALYSEVLPGGYLNVMLNETGAESNVQLEALFNTVLQNKKTIKDLFTE